MDSWSRETQTSTAHPVNRTWQSQSLVPREKEQFTFQQPSPWDAGFTRGSWSKSAERINALICSRLRRQRVHLECSDANRTEKLRVSAILLGIVGGIVGLAAGLFLGFAPDAILARVMHVSSFEGGAGYFAISIALLVTVLVAPIVILLTLYWLGTRGIWLFIGLVIVCVSMFAIAASGLGIWYAAQPHVLNLNGPTPLLEFEVKPPQGESVENLDNVEPELDTDRNAMPCTWRTEPPETAEVRAGYMGMYFRTSRRLFVLKFPAHEDRISIFICQRIR